MSPTVALDSSPESVLRALRGTVIAAQTAYPDVLHVTVADAAGGLWRLASQDADYLPDDPSQLVGRVVENVMIDAATGALACRVDGSLSLEVRPSAAQAPDDPPSWELIAPNGLTLEFGPGLRWRIAATDSSSACA